MQVDGTSVDGSGENAILEHLGPNKDLNFGLSRSLVKTVAPGSTCSGSCWKWVLSSNIPGFSANHASPSHYRVPRCQEGAHNDHFREGCTFPHF